MQNKPIYSLLLKAANHLLAENHYTATAVLQQAAQLSQSDEQIHALFARFHLLLRYGQYDRFPGENNIFTADVYVRKEKTGGMPSTTPEPLPMPAERNCRKLPTFSIPASSNGNGAASVTSCGAAA